MPVPLLCPFLFCYAHLERANFWDVVGKGGSSFHPNRLNSRLHIGRLKVQQVRKNPFHGGFLQLVPVPLLNLLLLVHFVPEPRSGFIS